MVCVCVWCVFVDGVCVDGDGVCVDRWCVGVCLWTCVFQLVASLSVCACLLLCVPVSFNWWPLVGLCVYVPMCLSIGLCVLCVLTSCWFVCGLVLSDCYDATLILTTNLIQN